MNSFQLPMMPVAFHYFCVSCRSGTYRQIPYYSFPCRTYHVVLCWCPDNRQILIFKIVGLVCFGWCIWSTYCVRFLSTMPSIQKELCSQDVVLLQIRTYNLPDRHLFLCGTMLACNLDIFMHGFSQFLFSEVRVCYFSMVTDVSYPTTTVSHAREDLSYLFCSLAGNINAVVL